MSGQPSGRHPLSAVCYIPRTAPVCAEARVGADRQADIAKAILSILTTDGVRHEVTVTLYASPIDSDTLVLDVDTAPELRYGLRLYCNDAPLYPQLNR